MASLFSHAVAALGPFLVLGGGDEPFEGRIRSRGEPDVVVRVGRGAAYHSSRRLRGPMAKSGRKETISIPVSRRRQGESAGFRDPGALSNGTA